MIVLSATQFLDQSSEGTAARAAVKAPAAHNCCVYRASIIPSSFMFSSAVVARIVIRAFFLCSAACLASFSHFSSSGCLLLAAGEALNELHHSHREALPLKDRERELFIGTQFSILYTSMYSPAEAATHV